MPFLSCCGDFSIYYSFVISISIRSVEWKTGLSIKLWLYIWGGNKGSRVWTGTLNCFSVLFVPLTVVPWQPGDTGIPWRGRRNPALMLCGYDQLSVVAGSQPPKAAVVVHLLSFKYLLLSEFPSSYRKALYSSYNSMQ